MRQNIVPFCWIRTTSQESVRFGIRRNALPPVFIVSFVHTLLLFATGQETAGQDGTELMSCFPSYAPLFARISVVSERLEGQGE